MLVADEDVDPFGSQHAFAVVQRQSRCNIQDEIVALVTSSEVCLGEVDDVVRAERADHLQLLPRNRHPNSRPVRLGDLDGNAAYTTPCAVDRHTLSSLEPARAARLSLTWAQPRPVRT